MLQTGGAVMCASGTGSRWSPKALFAPTTPSRGSAPGGRRDTFFGGLQRGFTVKVRDSGEDDELRAACLEAGLELFGDPVPEMICRTALPDARSVYDVTRARG